MTNENQNEIAPQPPEAPAHGHSQIRVFAIGTAGAAIAEELMRSGFEPRAVAVLKTNAKALAKSSAAEKIHLPHGKKRGTHTAHQSAELLSQLNRLCEGADTAFIVVGMGGRTGTDLAPFVAKTAKEAGLTTLAFVTLPFECEGSLRQEKARAGLGALKAVADGVICLPGQKILKLIDENTSLPGTFNVSNALLGDAARGVARMLTGGGLIDVHLTDLCALLDGGRESECLFATADASGPNRSREVVEKLLAHPLLDDGQALADAEAVLVNVIGGPNLAMADFNRLMEQINQRCDGSHVTLGAAVDESFENRLAVTLLASRRHDGTKPMLPAAASATDTAHPSASGDDADLPNRMLPSPTTSRPHSRPVPPVPGRTQDSEPEPRTKIEDPQVRRRRGATKLRQEQLPLELVSKGRFDKCEPTIHKGEDLDLPTYVRRGVVLN